MALQLNYTAPTGITLPTAYAHITSFGGNKTGMQCQLTVFKDVAAKNAFLQPVGTLQAKLTIANGATMAELYAALKLQAPFIGATDV